MHQNNTKGLAPKHVYYHRLWRSILFTVIILGILLIIGTLGFKYLGIGVQWIDAFHNASMLLSGMGPVLSTNQMNDTTKLFSSFYAIFSGVAFIGTIGILLAPVAHRLFHRFHLEDT